MAKNLGRLLGNGKPRVIDLLVHLPFRRTLLRPLDDATLLEEDVQVTLKGEVGKCVAGRTRRLPSRITFHAVDEEIDLVFFGQAPTQLTKRFPEGRMLTIFGRLTRYNDRWQIAHPDRLDLPDGNIPKSLPVYPSIEAVPQWRIRSLAREAVKLAPELPEWLPNDFLQSRNWPSWCRALRTIHSGDVDPADLVTGERSRLAFDELLANQIVLRVMRPHLSEGRPLIGSGKLKDALLASLPYTLTPSQQRAVLEISADMEKHSAMRRLLQGDVGAGKTLVALMAMVGAVEAGTQAAMMAPTEVLAEQHARTITTLIAPLELKTALLTGKTKGKARADLLGEIKDGSVDIVIGTHALFQAGVEFFDLGLAIIDEQHRFGVNQRLQLTQKGKTVDHLLMTATPIPRSLILSHYGDIATSKLEEKPAGRQPIRTSALSKDRMDELLGSTGRALQNGDRVFWICPLVELSDKSDLQAAVERYDDLRRHFGDIVGLVHGQMRADEKSSAMQAFAEGETGLLVATTVIEVGIDVPEASIIIIEHAERFGLAQLHQLRGRVGRGAKPSACVLLYEPPLGPVAKARLKIMRESNDGFRIADEDLRLRGPGDVLGTKQSGFPELRFADLAAHEHLLDDARRLAGTMLEESGTASDKIGLLLHLFDRQEAVARLAAG